MIDATPAVPEYSREALLACARGAFGNGRFPRLPLPPMLSVERVTSVTLPDEDGNGGEIVGSSGTEHYQWLFTSHFHDDPVMPGTILIEALLQLTGFYGGLLGFEGRGRATRIGSSKFLRAISPTDRRIDYVVSVTRVFAARQLIIADGAVSIAGIPCAEVRGLCVAIVSEPSVPVAATVTATVTAAAIARRHYTDPTRRDAAHQSAPALPRAEVQE